jgi:hypothetical protein
MIIKELLRKAAEKLTGRKCCYCRHNVASRCCHPDGKMFMRCWHSVTRPGYAGKFEKENALPPDHGDQAAQVAELTQEEEYQLQRIREVLQQAEDDARESGLLAED